MLRALAVRRSWPVRCPTVVHHEPEAARLVLRSPGGARDWSRASRRGRFPRVSAAGPRPSARGRARDSGRGVDGLPARHRPMWALSLPEPPHELLLDLSAGALDLVARLQASRPCATVCAGCATPSATTARARRPALGQLPRGRGARLAAPDARAADGLGAGRPRCRGVRRRDRPRRVPARLGRVDPDRRAERSGSAGRPTRDIRCGACSRRSQAFWSAYRLASRGHPTLRRVVELAAVRLLQMAVERAQGLARAVGARGHAAAAGRQHAARSRRRRR